MLNKKDKYYLRNKANVLKPIVIIGKDGLTSNTIASINDVLRTKELIKVSILKTFSGLEKKELAELIASTTNSEVILVIGRVIVLYRKNVEINAYGIK